MTDCKAPPDWNDDDFVLPEIPDGVAVGTVTEGCVEGHGIYDVFMRAHRDAIQQEYAKQRLKGSEYSKVYLGGMQQAMQSAVAFALSKDEAAAKKELAKYEILKAQAAIELVQAQVCETEKKIELLTAQRQMTAAQTWAEIAKTTPAIDPQMRAMLNIDDVGEPIIGGSPDYTGPAMVAPGSLISGQVNKTAAEETLLIRKGLTEMAQIEDEYLLALGKRVPVTGVVGKEKNLLQRQADGFVRDAEAKIAKIATDAFAVQYSTLDGVAVDELAGWGWKSENLFTMLNNAYQNMANASHTDGPVPNFAKDYDPTKPSDGDLPDAFNPAAANEDTKE